TEVSAIGSLSRVVISLLAFGVLVSFPVLLVTAVRASAKHRRTDLPMPTTAPAPGAAPSTGTSLPIGPSSGARAGTSTGTGTATRPAPTDSRAGGEATNRPQMRPDGLDRRALTSVLLGLGSVLGVTALGSALDRAQGSLPAAPDSGGTPGGGPVTPTGESTTIAVSMADMRFSPDVLEVPAGNTLVIELRNDDPADVHDLVLADGTTSGRLRPGQSATVTSGVISDDLEGWCSIAGHRAMGMTLRVEALGGAAGAGTTAAGADPLA